LSVPGLAISIVLLLTVASTLPSITRTSQFEISTPFSRMFTPMNNLLPAESALSAAEVALLGAAAGVEGRCAGGVWSRGTEAGEGMESRVVGTLGGSGLVVTPV